MLSEISETDDTDYFSNLKTTRRSTGFSSSQQDVLKPNFLQSNRVRMKKVIAQVNARWHNLPSWINRAKVPLSNSTLRLLPQIKAKQLVIEQIKLELQDQFINYDHKDPVCTAECREVIPVSSFRSTVYRGNPEHIPEDFMPDPVYRYFKIANAVPTESDTYSTQITPSFAIRQARRPPNLQPNFVFDSSCENISSTPAPLQYSFGCEETSQIETIYGTSEGEYLRNTNSLIIDSSFDESIQILLD